MPATSLKKIIKKHKEAWWLLKNRKGLSSEANAKFFVFETLSAMWLENEWLLFILHHPKKLVSPDHNFLSFKKLASNKKRSSKHTQKKSF